AGVNRFCSRSVLLWRNTDFLGIYADSADVAGFSANRQCQEGSRQSQRWVANQLVGSSGMWSNPCPLMQMSSVPLHPRKLQDGCPTRAGFESKQRHTGHRFRWSWSTHRNPMRRGRNAASASIPAASDKLAGWLANAKAVDQRKTIIATSRNFE